MIKLAILLVLATLGVGVSAALLLRLLPALRLQLAGLALLAVILPLAGVLASGWVMFEMRADTEVLAVSSAAALSSLGAALLLARWIREPLDDLRRASAALAAGDLASRASERGPAEVAEVAHAFNAMADSIERLFEARRELVAWASHDLRTPLASMQAMIEAIDDGLAEPREYLPSLAEQVHTLSSLVDDLFELARIDAGVLTQQIEQADIERVISSCVRGFEAEARAKGIRLEAPARGQVPPVRCAPDQLQRVLFNLLTNAIRHTPPDGAIAIAISPSVHDVTIAVEDTGEGVSAEAAARMFDRFWRAESARASAGSGLGLAIARALVEAHGGRIWAENRASGGARVAFTLPTTR
ncbi:MAG: HAMP domain-containing sensor histidine kinase [Solirubrobacteraceae bacterium]|jgi:signal transduction histidine kinase